MLQELLRTESSYLRFVASLDGIAERFVARVRAGTDERGPRWTPGAGHGTLGLRQNSAYATFSIAPSHADRHLVNTP